MSLILLLVVLFIVCGGGGAHFYTRTGLDGRPSYPYRAYALPGLGTLLLIVIVVEVLVHL